MLRSQTNLASDYTYISKMDDALDKDACDFETLWEQYLDGASDCPLAPGKVPTIFHLRHLRAGAVDYFIRKNGSALLALKLALRDITGEQIPGFKLQHVHEDGIRMAALDDAPAELLPIFYEVGGRVIARLNPSGK